MNKRIFIVHGWDSHPDDSWFPWLKTELEKSGFQVETPAMPEPAAPKIEAWVSHLAKVVGEVDENTFFVGHSIGCQTILRYLERLPADRKIGGAFFVAGWLTLQNLETEEEKEIARPWLETRIDFEKVKQHTNNFFALFSDNDPFVALDNQKFFEEKMGARTALEHNKGHFSEHDGVRDIPLLLKEILTR